MISSPDRRMARERRLTVLFRIALALVICLGLWECRHGWPVSSSLLDLVPVAQGDALRQRADDRIQEPLQRQVIALVSADDRERAVELARGMGHAWRHSGLFADVQVDVDVDVDGVRKQLLSQPLALLPPRARDTLIRDPASYAARRVRELANPFSSTGLVPADDDLLGLSHAAERALRTPGAVQLDLVSGTLIAHDGTRDWVLVRAQTSGDAFDGASPGQVARLVDETRASVVKDGGRMLVAGGPLYAAEGRARAAGESTWISAMAVLGIIALLLLTMRGWRSLLAFVPVAVGLLCGAVACVALFGTIHILTLVVGASLIGIAIDFPMHLLAKRYGMPDWQAWPALHRVLPGLTISLAVTMVGYLALVFTPFPALTQTAVFSAAGLFGAYACTVCELPNWLRGWQPRPFTPLLSLAQALLRRLALWSGRRPTLPWLAAGIALVSIAGISHLRVQDDLRQWLALPAPLLQQAQQIGRITGIQPTSQYYLVRAADTNALWERQNALDTRLDALVKAKALDSYLSLNQLVAPEGAQRALLDALRDPNWRARLVPSFEAVGIPAQAVIQQVDALAAQEPVTVDKVLQGPLGQSRRMLWLGQDHGQVAAMVVLQGLHDPAAAQAAAQGLEGVSFVDRSGQLNETFTQTRIRAAELKLLSYVAAGALLWLTLGRSATWRLLAVPLTATACTLATLGLLGQPLTLFSLFGLLLVSAIGLDYAIVMYERVAGAAASFVGIVLAAATTVLSFGLLAFSSTPAISNFGMSVGIGVAFCVLWAPWVRPAGDAMPAVSANHIKKA
ncbi:MMPL family transporter [Bordetella genomosp. 11]|nr:MMPL family transporter [Bordetella genomosp. 11]